MTAFSRTPRSAEELRCRRLLRRAPAVVWKRFADGHELRLRLFLPAGHRAEYFAPAVLFYSGGMWAVENMSEFVAWSVHLSHRGVVCLIPEYRTPDRYDVTAEEILTDGRDAWRWLHHNAAGLGIDRERITLAGADAGGLMALVATMQPLREQRRWWRPGSRDVPPLQPAAVAIFRGVVDTEAPEARTLHVPESVPDPSAVNPCDLLRRCLPPLFCAHGMLDPLLDYGMREWFCAEWRSLGNHAEWVLCPAGDHTLTGFGTNPAVFEQVLLAWLHFMVREGIWPESCAAGDALME